MNIVNCPICGKNYDASSGNCPRCSQQIGTISVSPPRVRTHKPQCSETFESSNNAVELNEKNCKEQKVAITTESFPENDASTNNIEVKEHQKIKTSVFTIILVVFVILGITAILILFLTNKNDFGSSPTAEIISQEKSDEEIARAIKNRFGDSAKEVIYQSYQCRIYLSYSNAVNRKLLEAARDSKLTEIKNAWIEYRTAILSIVMFESNTTPVIYIYDYTADIDEEYASSGALAIAVYNHDKGRYDLPFDIFLS